MESLMKTAKKLTGKITRLELKRNVRFEPVQNHYIGINIKKLPHAQNVVFILETCLKRLFFYVCSRPNSQRLLRNTCLHTLQLFFAQQYH